MDILDELKQQSTVDEDMPGSSQDVLKQLATYKRSHVLDAITQVHAYLHELTSSLNRLNYITQTDFTIADLGTIKDLNQANYSLSFENRADVDIVSLNFMLSTETTIAFGFETETGNNIAESLTRAGIDAKISNKSGQIKINGTIPVKLEFSSIPDEQHILLSIHNYDKPGRQRYAIAPNMIDDHFQNQLGKFILRRKNNLIMELQDFIKASTDSLLQPYEDVTESDFHTQEMDISRIKSLFGKEARLYLTYQNVIKEVCTKTDSFILGRSRNCDMKVGSDLASRQHAKILYRKGKFVLIDTSTNGTFVKLQGGKEVYLQGEEHPLSGSGFISLGKSVTVDNEHVVYFSVQ
ncbi:MAG: FHA domain-containing protein [Gammaproteobacteria bacterium]|nr:FHA domain-containing protein [Gammaproteobacteria bacterium]MDH5776703.1 FHA domain-containing protein [Gammaproteobacteria bacterium]